jgi:8-oxo-dGTP diphosphatase
MIERPHVVVTAAVIESGGRFLVTRRQRGVHLEGFWEFPGGKCERNESLDQCLKRELLEELGTPSSIGREILAVTHEYPERVVELHFIACTLDGEPQQLLGQEMRWVAREELAQLPFPPADEEVIAVLCGTGDQR